MKRRYLFTCILMLSALFVKADIFDDVANALKSGNAKEISKYFNANVELTILSDEGVYSKQQAELVLKDFLSHNTPKSVVIQHRGSSAQGAKYAIAVYECVQGKYRAYIFMKDSGNGMVIHELRIEKD